MSQYLAFAPKQYPEESSWDHLVNIPAAEEFLAALKNCKSKSATLLTYTKSLGLALSFAQKRWLRCPERPTEAEYNLKLTEATTFWADQQRNFDRKAKQQRNVKLATGAEVIADLDACNTYLEDAVVRAKLESSFKAVEDHAKLRSPLKFTRADVTPTASYNYIIRYLMMSAIIRNGGPRTGVLENLKQTEVETAKKVQAAGENGAVRTNYIVSVSEHKTKDSGITHLVLDEEDFPLWTRFLAIRKKLRVSDRDSSKLFFVTTGGKPFRRPHDDINRYMKVSDGYLVSY